MLTRILKEDFFRSVGLLVSGTAIGQVISLIALPILTRLYTPEEFSQLSLFLAFVGIISTVSCLRFEVAIPLSKSCEEKNNLSILAILSLLCFCLLLMLFSFLASSYIDDSRINIDFVLLAIVAIFSLGLFNVLDFLVVRDKNFKLSSKTKIMQSVAQNGSQCFFGIVNFSNGLLSGYVCYVMFGVLCYRRYVWAIVKMFSTVNFTSLMKTATNYSNYPKFSTFQALFNISAIQVPIMIIAIYGISPDAGYLMLAMRVMQAPLSLVATSVSQVYMAHAEEQNKNNNLYSYTVDVIKKLIKFGMLPLVLLGFSAPYVFPIAFGPDWKQAGIYTLYLTPWFCLQLVSSPISYAMDILYKQKVGMFFQLFGSIMRVLSVIIPLLYMKEMMIISHAASGFVFYLLYLVVIMLYLNRDRKLRFNN